MKLSDVQAKVDEGFLDAVSRTGLTGGNRQEIATQKRQNELMYNKGLAKFTNELRMALDSAVDSGIVSTTVQQKSTPPQIAPQQSQTTSSPSAPATATASSVDAPSPEDIRKTKQAAAAKAAQDQMSKSPATKQAAGNQPSPEDIRKTKQAAATTSSPTSKQLGPKGRETLARLGKKKQERASGAQGTLDLNESDYPDFNALLENIIGEQSYTDQQSVAEFIVDFFNQQVRLENLSVPSNYAAAMKRIADSIQAKYIATKKVDTASIEQLWKLLWSIYNTQQQRNVQRQDNYQPQNDPNQSVDLEALEDWKKTFAKRMENLDLGDPNASANLKELANKLLEYIKNIEARKQP